MQERVQSDPTVPGGHMFRSASAGSGHSLGSASGGVLKLGRSSQRRRTEARMDTYAQVGKQLLQLKVTWLLCIGRLARANVMHIALSLPPASCHHAHQATRCRQCVSAVHLSHSSLPCVFPLRDLCIATCNSEEYSAA